MNVEVERYGRHGVRAIVTGAGPLSPDGITEELAPIIMSAGEALAPHPYSIQVDEETQADGTRAVVIVLRAKTAREDVVLSEVAKQAVLKRMGPKGKDRDKAKGGVFEPKSHIERLLEEHERRTGKKVAVPADRKPRKQPPSGGGGRNGGR